MPHLLRTVSTPDSSTDDDQQLKYSNQHIMWYVRDPKMSCYHPRPKASSGFWLCILLPLALITNCLNCTNTTKCNIPRNYQIITVAAIGTSLESIMFFLKLLHNQVFHHAWSVFILQVPTVLTACLMKLLLITSWPEAIFWSKLLTWIYHSAYKTVMIKLPYSFTYGEAGLLMQGLWMFLINAILLLYDELYNRSQFPDEEDFHQLNFIMMTALLWLFIVCLLLIGFKYLHHSHRFYSVLVIFAVCATCLPLTEPIPLLVVARFIYKDILRLYFVLFYVVLISVTIWAVTWQLHETEQASTATRKIFHIVMVMVYIPGIIYQCGLLYLASGIAFALMTIIELLRFCCIPPFSDILKAAFHSFADNKDSGLIAVTPFALLIGCSLPLWLHLNPCSNIDSNPQYFLSLLAGVLTIGCGDTAASIIGSKCGRIKWKNSSRTLEGSVAFVIAIAVCLVGLLLAGSLPVFTFIETAWIMSVIVVSALVEAHTDQIDNLVLPLIFYILINMKF